MTLIIDGHLDLAYNALYHRRDLTQPVQVLREREDPYRDGVAPSQVHPDALRKQPRTDMPGVATVALPEMRAGRVGIVLSTIMSRVQLPNPVLGDGMRTQLAAHAMGQAHLHYYRALERQGQLSFIRSAQDLEQAATTWQGGGDRHDRPIDVRQLANFNSEQRSQTSNDDKEVEDADEQRPANGKQWQIAAFSHRRGRPGPCRPRQNPCGHRRAGVQRGRAGLQLAPALPSARPPR